MVVSDKERGIGQSGVVLTLGIDGMIDGNVVSFALYDDEGVISHPSYPVGCAR